LNSVVRYFVDCDDLERLFAKSKDALMIDNLISGSDTAEKLRLVAGNVEYLRAVQL